MWSSHLIRNYSDSNNWCFISNLASKFSHILWSQCDSRRKSLCLPWVLFLQAALDHPIVNTKQPVNGRAVVWRSLLWKVENTHRIFKRSSRVLWEKQVKFSGEKIQQFPHYGWISFSVLPPWSIGCRLPSGAQHCSAHRPSWLRGIYHAVAPVPFAFSVQQPCFRSDSWTFPQFSGLKRDICHVQTSTPKSCLNIIAFLPLCDIYRTIFATLLLNDSPREK